MSRQYFGTDGIRDVAGQGLLSLELVTSYGHAIGSWLSGQTAGAKVLVGRDTRASGPALLDQLGVGVIAAGHELVDGGVLPTPAVQTLCREERFDLAIVISASHNPAADNGLKFFGADGRKLADEAEESIEREIAEVLTKGPPSPGASGGSRRSDPEAGGRYLGSASPTIPTRAMAPTVSTQWATSGSSTARLPTTYRRTKRLSSSRPTHRCCTLPVRRKLRLMTYTRCMISSKSWWHRTGA